VFSFIGMLFIAGVFLVCLVVVLASSSCQWQGVCGCVSLAHSPVTVRSGKLRPPLVDNSCWRIALILLFSHMTLPSWSSDIAVFVM
jgi:hypothetical protein